MVPPADTAAAAAARVLIPELEVAIGAGAGTVVVVGLVVRKDSLRSPTRLSRRRGKRKLGAAELKDSFAVIRTSSPPYPRLEAEGNPPKEL